jgi:hypothetical protein
MSIDVRFFITWEEYYLAQQRLAPRYFGLTPEQYLGAALMLFGAFLWLAGSHISFSLGALAAGLGFLTKLSLFRRLELRRKWAREPLHRTEHLVSFDEQGINYTQSHVQSRLDWGYYQRILETGDGFLLICGEDVFSLIPKRAFANEQTISEFRKLATAKLSGQ